MAFECFVFWTLAWLCLELFSTRFVAYHLALVLSFIFFLVASLLSIGLDLLGFFVASVYASAFVAVSLMALQFGPFWSLSCQPNPSAVQRRWLWLGVFLVLGGCLWFVATPVATSWDGLILWQDLLKADTTGLTSQASLLHWLFYRAFIIETLALNLYLMLGLVSVLFVLLIRLTLDLAALAMTSLSASWRGGLFSRTRVLSKFRRQTRRSNSSRLRQR